MENHRKKIETARKIELTINRNLFLVCSIVTFISMALVLADFFSRGRFDSTNIGTFYMCIVLIYTIHKEFIHWLGEKPEKHHGEYFVYSWILLTSVLYAINFFTNNYFSPDNASNLTDASVITVEVLGIFVVTRILKVFAIFRN